MKEYFKQSFKIVTSNLTFIFILGFTGMYAHFGATSLIGICHMIIAFVIIPVAYGRFTEILTGEERLPFIQVFKKHWLNFFIVTIIFTVPLFLYAFFLEDSLAWKLTMIIGFIINAVIKILTIYVWPLVFIKKENIKAILAGVLYLIGSFRYSLPLVALLSFVFVIKSLLLIYIFPLIPANSFIFAIAGYMHNFVFWGIEFMIFITATMILLKETSLKAQVKQ